MKIRGSLPNGAVGGEFECSVPYDLSQGAWQDPTHVRAFNENSWKYYTESAQYLGWRDARFDKKRVIFIMSEFGARLAQKEGRTVGELLHIAWAISGMIVTLRKRPSTEEEKARYDKRTRAFYTNSAGEWLIDAPKNSDDLLAGQKDHARTNI